MITLIITTLVTGFLDSLNPIAISQQFFLQSTVKKQTHIWYYISAIFITNFIGGLLAYYGVLNPLFSYVDFLFHEYEEIIFYLKALLILILSLLFLIQIYHMIEDPKPVMNTNKRKRTFQKVTPLSLICIGFLTTLSELATALPYFAFLTILFNYHMQLLFLFIILFLYNFMYCLPLFIMYFVYIEKQTQFEHYYDVIKQPMTKLLPYLTPFLCFAIISFLLSTFF